mgnify:CR=1 FL=1
MKSHVTDYVLYRWRFGLGLLIIAVIIGVIVWGGALQTPGELRPEEIKSVSISSSLSRNSLDPAMIVNFPYHLLQRLSIYAFGATTFAIKLPSLVLATFTILGVLVLTQSWLKRNVAMITTMALATTTQFLFMAQDGTPAITFNAIAVWLLVAGLRVTRGKYFHTFWKIAGGVLMAVALYVPLGIYVVVSLLITSVLHPHIRYIMKRLGKTKLLMAAILGLASMAPLVYAIVIQPSTALELAGLPSDISFAHIRATAPQAILDLAGFSAHSSGALLRPAYSLTLALVALIGLYRLITTHYTARSYVTIILSVLLVPLILLTPAHISALFFVMTILIATGFDFLIRYWYRLFPRNPYARLAGLLPLAVLVIGIIATNVTHYMDGYRYAPSVLAHYSSDLNLIHAYASKHDQMALVATEQEREFYHIVAERSPKITLRDQADQSPGTIVLTRNARRSMPAAPESWQLEQIITNGRAEQSDRLYVYKILQ